MNLRILYAADMHGSEQVWRKFVNAAAFYSVDVLILGGDVTGKIMVPIIEEKPGKYVARVYDKLERAKGERELAALEKRLRFVGYYPLQCSREEYERVARDEHHRMDVMKRLMVETAARWAAIADEKLQGTNVRIYGMAGNDDGQEIDDALRGEHLINVESRVIRIGEYQLLSCAWGNESPWNTPRELPEDQLLEKLEGLAAALEPNVPTIFNLHIPPYDSGLDTGPKVQGVDANGQVVVERLGGQVTEVPVGSKAVRTLVERYQPVVSFHSHIHESRKAATIGGTLCINPGSDYQDGVLDSALVELEDDEVKSYQLVSG